MRKSNHNLLKQLLVSSFFILCFSTYAQLSGTYTLGDDTSDYLTFSDAVNDIKNQGMAADIEFLVKPGSYSNVIITDVENPNEYQIVFAYNNEINDSAVIIGQIKVKNTDYVSFSGFSIFPIEYQVVSCVWVSESNYFSLSHCKVINNHNVDFDNAMIYLGFLWDGPYYVAEISSCVINEDEKTFSFGGKQGSVWLRNNIISGVIHHKNKDIRAGMRLHWHDNIFNITDRDFTGVGQSFHGNTFYFESIFDLKIQGELYGNTFHCSSELISGDVISNIFYKDIEMKWMNNAEFTSNLVYGKLRSVFSHGIKIRGNIFYDNVDLNNDNTSFGNNFVFDSVTFSHGPGQLIYNNNFSSNGYLEMNFTGGTIKNNNIGNMVIWQPSITNIENNNFVNLGNGNVNIYGENAHFTNPFYQNDTNLHARNPMLIGKGGDNHAKFKYDIDSIWRKEPCTIGANEICFDWQLQELTLMCSDSIQLDLCLDTLVNMYWSPTYLFDDSTSVNPLIYPEDSTTIYLNESDGILLDSLIINISAVEPIAFANYSSEGLTVSFNNQSSCADRYLWNFGDGESSSEESPTHEYGTDGSYLCTMEASNYLGTAYWSVLLTLVSVNEHFEDNTTLVVFPNPADNYVSVKSTKDISNIEIYNLFGELLFSQKTNSDKLFTIDISFLSEGLYLIKVETDNSINTIVFSK